MAERLALWFDSSRMPTSRMRMVSMTVTLASSPREEGEYLLPPLMSSVLLDQNVSRELVAAWDRMGWPFRGVVSMTELPSPYARPRSPWRSEMFTLRIAR